MIHCCKTKINSQNLKYFFIKKKINFLFKKFSGHQLMKSSGHQLKSNFTEISDRFEKKIIDYTNFKG